MNFKTYAGDMAGNVAMTLALAAPVVMGGLGYAVSLHGLVSAEMELQDQLDSATIAAAAAEAGGTTDEEELRSLILAVLDSNNFDTEAVQPDISIDNGIITVSATINEPSFMGGLTGRDDHDIRASSQARLGMDGPVEIVLVLDNTASMGVDGKIGALRLGADALIDAVERSQSDSRMALVPFAKYVNVGLDKRNEPWIDLPGEYDTEREWQQATHHEHECRMEMVEVNRDGAVSLEEREICDPTRTTYETMTRTIETRWIGCVGSRGRALDRLDNPRPAFPGMLNTIPREASGESRDLDTKCPFPVRPLTQDYDALRADIIGMFPTDETYLPHGIMWGRRVLSPGEPFTETEGDGIRQVMVVLSDGMNTAELLTSQGAEVDDAPIPYIASLPDLTLPSVSADTDTLAACTAAKQDGIEIYTIAFRINAITQHSLLRQCASSPAHALRADDNASVVTAFETLSGRLQSEVRLAR